MSYVEIFDPRDESQAHITVVPRYVEYMPLDRSSNKFHGWIDLYVSKRLSVGSRPEIDGMMRMVEDIADGYRLQRVDGYVAARCIKVNQHFLNEVALTRQNRFALRLELVFELAL